MSDGCAKYFGCFSKLLPMKRLKVILWKDRKIQLLNIFRCQDIPKNGLHSEIMFPPQFATSVKVTWKTIVFLKFWLVIFKYWFIFNKRPSSSRVIFKSILHVNQNVCHSEGLLIHITVHNSAFSLSYLLNGKLYT